MEERDDFESTTAEGHIRALRASYRAQLAHLLRRFAGREVLGNDDLASVFLAASLAGVDVTAMLVKVDRLHISTIAEAQDRFNSSIAKVQVRTSGLSGKSMKDLLRRIAYQLEQLDKVPSYDENSAMARILNG